MVDTSAKITQILTLVEAGEYFTINRPRQFGKTTILSRLAQRINARDDAVALKISFEEIDSASYQRPETFIAIFLDMLRRESEFLRLPELSHYIEQQRETSTHFPALSQVTTQLVRMLLPQKSLVLLIDEVDRSTNNHLFLDFLAMLRYKYLQRSEGRDHTFQSVILVGVHDVKTLKAHIRDGEETRYNSPWNIAVDFEVDLSFAPREIETMLHDYSREKEIQPDIPAIADTLYYYTSGYPYLVSKLCKFIDEKIVPPKR